MSKDRQTGLYSPPSVDGAPLPIAASMKAEFKEAIPESCAAGSDEADGVDGTKNGKKSLKKSGWLRRKGLKAALGSF